MIRLYLVNVIMENNCRRRFNGPFDLINVLEMQGS